MSMAMAEILNDASKVKPIFRTGGRDVYAAEDAQKLNKAELMEERATGRVELGARDVNPDGTYSSCRANNVAIDPATFFDNRFRKVGQTYEVVTDYRAVKEQETGRIYTDNIVVHVIHKEDKKLAVKETKTISASEFIKSFKQKLDVGSMASIYAILQDTGSDMPTSKLEL